MNTVDDLGTDISNFFSRPALYFGLAVLVAVSVVVAWLIRRSGRSERGLWWLSLAVGSALYITAFTLFRDGPPRGLHVGSLVRLPQLDWNHFSYDPLGSSQFLLNVLLFVPCAAVLTALTRRPWRVFAWLSVGILAIEWLQGLLGVGVKDAEDLVSNALGAACGVVVGSLVVRFALGGTTRWSNRRRTVTTVAVLAGVAAMWVGLAYGAEARQDRLVSAVEKRFANHTLTQIQQDLESDSESVWTLGGVRTSGGPVRDTTARIRYPASFFGVQRCVFAVWDGGPWRVERAAGDACTEFLG